jgi:hypothetical protein
MEEVRFYFKVILSLFFVILRRSRRISARFFAIGLTEILHFVQDDNTRIRAGT